MTQSKAVEIVTNYTTITLVIAQRAQAYIRRYIVTDKLEYCGCKARMYSYAYHVKICQHPSKFLKSCWDAHIRKAVKKL